MSFTRSSTTALLLAVPIWVFFSGVAQAQTEPPPVMKCEGANGGEGGATGVDNSGSVQAVDKAKRYAEASAKNRARDGLEAKLQCTGECPTGYKKYGKPELYWKTVECKASSVGGFFDRPVGDNEIRACNLECTAHGWDADDCKDWCKDGSWKENAVSGERKANIYALATATCAGEGEQLCILDSTCSQVNDATKECLEAVFGSDGVSLGEFLEMGVDASL